MLFLTDMGIEITRKNTNFESQELFTALEKLQVEYTVSEDRKLSSLSFCSILSPQNSGIFYLEKKRDDLSHLKNCIFFAHETHDAQQSLTIKVSHPQLTFYKLMEYFFSPKEQLKGIHATAIVDQEAQISKEAYVGPYCVIGKATIKAGSHLDSHVVVHDQSTIEENVVIESHTTIGATGVAWIWDEENQRRILQPQLGSTLIGKNSFLGTDITIVRGSINEVTSLGEGCMLAHGTKIGHGSKIGNGVHFANNVSIAGSVWIGDQAFLSSACVLRPGIRIAKNVVVGAGAVVTKNIDEPNAIVAGVPAIKIEKKLKHSGIPQRQG